MRRFLQTCPFLPMDIWSNMKCSYFTSFFMIAVKRIVIPMKPYFLQISRQNISTHRFLSFRAACCKNIQINNAPLPTPKYYFVSIFPITPRASHALLLPKLGGLQCCCCYCYCCVVVVVAVAGVAPTNVAFLYPGRPIQK